MQSAIRSTSRDIRHVRRRHGIGKGSSSVNALLNAQSFQRVPICFDEAAETQSVERPSRVNKSSVYPRGMSCHRSMRKGGSLLELVLYLLL